MSSMANGQGGMANKELQEARRLRQQVANVPVRPGGGGPGGPGQNNGYNGPGLSPEAAAQIARQLADFGKKDAERAQKEIAKAQDHYAGERSRIRGEMAAANDVIADRLAAIEGGGGSSRPHTYDGPSPADIRAAAETRAEYNGLRNDLVASLQGSYDNASDSGFLNENSTADPTLDTLTNSQTPAEYAMADPSKFEPGQNLGDYPASASLPIDGQNSAVPQGEVPADGNSPVEPGGERSAENTASPSESSATEPQTNADPAAEGQPAQAPTQNLQSPSEQSPPSEQNAPPESTPSNTAVASQSEPAPAESGAQPEAKASAPTELAQNDQTAKPSQESDSETKPDVEAPPQQASQANQSDAAPVETNTSAPTEFASNTTTTKSPVDDNPPVESGFVNTPAAAKSEADANNSPAQVAPSSEAAPDSTQSRTTAGTTADASQNNNDSLAPTQHAKVEVPVRENSSSFKDLPPKEQTEINRQTDETFYKNNPEMAGRKIDPRTQPEQAQEWKEARQDILDQREDAHRDLTAREQTQVNKITDDEFRADYGWKSDQNIDPKTQPEMAQNWKDRQSHNEEFVRAKNDADTAWEKNKSLSESRGSRDNLGEEKIPPSERHAPERPDRSETSPRVPETISNSNEASANGNIAVSGKASPLNSASEARNVPSSSSSSAPPSNSDAVRQARQEEQFQPGQKSESSISRPVSPSEQAAYDQLAKNDAEFNRRIKEEMANPDSRIGQIQRGDWSGVGEDMRNGKLPENGYRLPPVEGSSQSPASQTPDRLELGSPFNSFPPRDHPPSLPQSQPQESPGFFEGLGNSASSTVNNAIERTKNNFNQSVYDLKKSGADRWNSGLQEGSPLWINVEPPNSKPSPTRSNTSSLVASDPLYTIGGQFNDLAKQGGRALRIVAPTGSQAIEQVTDANKALIKNNGDPNAAARDYTLGLGTSAVIGVAMSQNRNIPSKRPPEGPVVLYKWRNSTAESPIPGISEKGEYMLWFPDKQDSDSAYWNVNKARLLSVMSRRTPIFDSHTDSLGNLIPTTGFLQSERLLLHENGWKYLPSLRAWVP